MWWLVVMTIVNSILHQYDVQNVYRIELGPIPLGIAEALMGIGFMLAITRGGSEHAKFPVIKSSPWLMWIIAPLVFGGLVSLALGTLWHNQSKYLMANCREFLAMPICVYTGYRLLGTPRAARLMPRVLIIAGVLTGFGLFHNFGETSEKASLTGSLNQLRGSINNWNSDYPAAAALLLFFVLTTRYKLWRTFVCVAIGIFCYVAYASTLSRTAFLVLIVGTGSVFALLPKGERLGKFIRAAIVLPLILFSLLGAVQFADSFIGRNFAYKVNKHFQSLLPSERVGSDVKAWDSRLDGIILETNLWFRNPLLGNGFGAAESYVLSGQATVGGASTRHNSWTSSLCETGLVGFGGLALMVFSMIYLGYRMVHERIDPIWVLFGALSFVYGVVTFCRFSSTMGITSRAAIGSALVAGMMLRAREMSLTQLAMERDNPYYDPYYDEQTGMLVPDYGQSFGQYGYN
jgi:hypothetical protein